jgi:hypothetical protein
LLVFQRELVHRPDEGGNIGAELAQLIVLVGDRLVQLGDGVSEPGFNFRGAATLRDAVVELGFQVGVALGERVAGDAGLLG